MKRSYEKPSLKKALVRLQAIAATGVTTGPSDTNGSDNSDGDNEGGTIS